MNHAKDLPWEKEKESFYHLEAMLKAAEQHWSSQELDKAWESANTACCKEPRHWGFLHNRAEIAAQQAEFDWVAKNDKTPDRNHRDKEN